VPLVLGGCGCVVIEVVTVDQDVINVGCNKGIQIRLLDIIDEVLEASRCIGQAKRHDKRLKHTIPFPKCYFQCCSVYYSDRTIYTMDIELGEVFGLL
jgi:hypothetical protein